MYGVDINDGVGRDVGSGDFNNDGADDVVIGATGDDRVIPGQGKVHIVYGPISVSLFDLSDSNITFDGISAGDGFGGAVDSGDFNNDGIDDLIIGARFAEGAGETTNNEGEIYIFYGPINENNANITFYGIDAGDHAGSVSYTHLTLPTTPYV